MKSTNIEYKEKITELKAYFYGANSERGFIMTADPTLDEERCSRKIIIKGGPGTGKSTLMRRFAQERQDSGYDVTEYYCSSDPDSLDAVKLEKDGERIVICDGTSPHALDPVYPGAVSTILDLSLFWDEAMLQTHRDEIVELSRKKKRCFERGYSFIAASHKVASISKSISESVFNEEKADEYVDRLISKCRLNGFKDRCVFTSAVSMKGAVAITSSQREKCDVYRIDDSFGCGALLLKTIAAKLKTSGVGAEKSLCPYDTQTIEEIYVPGAEKLFTLRPRAGKRINADRFVMSVASSYRPRFRFAEKCRRSLLDEALLSFEEASIYHFALEKIYTPAMDFSQINKLTL